FAPAGTPADVVQKIQRDAAAVLALPDVQSRLTGMGMTVETSTPEQLAAFLRTDIDQWKRVGTKAGVQPE
ncbi:MAG TPA: tripartite tricarboxylate transporter substrate-binding protein, partial [Rhodanobacteraceae bacterium]|nr:tripartite tricarboxylate transporter substrate-binding protein [Rhodanobacteraceae bacterium]